MERYELPKGWEWKQLFELADLKNGGTPSKFRTEYWKSGTIPFVTAADLTSLYIKHGRTFLTEQGLFSGKTAICEPGDILIGTRTRVGNCSIARLRMGASQDITRARLTDRCIPEYLCQYIRRIANAMAFFSQGTSIQGITREILSKLEIPVPPLPEQRRIVKRIEELTRRVQESRKLRTANLEDISRLLPSAMETCFQGDDDWIEKPLNELCVMKTGKTPPTSHPEYFNGDVPFVCPADVGERLLISDAQRSLSIKAIEDRKATVFEKGTVLLVCIGSTIGKIGLSARRLCTNQQITGLIFDDSVLPEYAAWFLTQQRETIRNAAAGGGVPIINQNGVGQLSIRFTEDKAEQRRIVEYLNGLQSKAEELKQLQSETEAELAAFTPALLAKAFRGEL